MLYALCYLDPFPIYLVHMASYWGSVCLVHLIKGQQFPNNWGVYATRVLMLQLLITPMFAPLVALLSSPLEKDMHAAWQLPLCAVLTEVIFSPIHLVIHRSKFLYRHVHALHHSKKPYIGVCALYATVYEHVILNMLPPLLAGLVARCNTWVACVWVAAATSNTVWVHSYNSNHHRHHANPASNYGIGTYLMDKYITKSFLV